MDSFLVQLSPSPIEKEIMIDINIQLKVIDQNYVGKIFLKTFDTAIIFQFLLQ